MIGRGFISAAIALLAIGAHQSAQAGIIERKVTADHLVGLYVRSDEAPGKLPGVIVLGGSEGGLNAAVTAEARALAAEGYAALQLGYFGTAQLPETLQLIPVEYFERAVAWLQHQPDVDPHRIAIMGTSVGGEAALLVAAHDPAINAVIAAVPSDIVWQGIGPWGDRDPESSFSMDGRPLPDLPYRVSETGTVFDRYAAGLSARGAHRQAFIPLMKIQGPVMLVCGGRDVVWPSCRMARAAAARLRAGGFTHPVVLLAFPKAGHAVFGPPFAASDPAYAGLGALGGTAAANDAARKTAWPRALAFLKAAFHPSAGGF
ncbi:MAG TPA: acyl-CoA thioester hydrolase/BAAT C-terminal domain-containing protein [Acidisoma sp.]|uniref:acyl-CoA thioester hydrolase/BAAT C-terminal domain-containing protein n=1 Tax=Acidisoma sp. TaxID=1872115 RepID=UPI002C0F0599|nr:acyl-CoA thioester hydrolase/BAAT C-terminal domain-containing protein [Acidisoma sp.]HTH99672.1 acyl-CoA thioester hydrolase/BAAT C-terminal domain-containing protein [Acidisoma sp.]